MGNRTIDHVVDQVVVIDHLPGGFGQTSQPLPEPIEILKFKEIEVTGLERPDMSVAKMISPTEGLRIMRASEASQVMPSKTCRECDDSLPSDRGLFCKKCLPHLPDDPGQYIYCGVSGE